MSKDFHGIYPMIYTFFDADGRIDRQAMKRQLAACVAGGVHGVAILGIVTEFNKLDVNERRQVIEWTAEDLAGRLPLAVTINELSVHGQVEMAKAAADAGADWIILQPPPIRNVPEAALVDFLGRVADAATLPVAIQNNPMNLDVWLSNNALKTLNRNHPNVTLLKGEGPIEYVRRMMEETGGVFRVFNGRGGLALRGGEVARCRRCAAVRLHAALLRLLTFIMASPEHMLCYGKRMFARRIGLHEVHPRQPCVMPSEFGLDIIGRYARDLPSLAAGRA